MKFSLAQHKKYMSKAMKVAQQSDDPSTKVGCVIVDDKGKVISTGFNHYPKQAKKNSFPTKREYKNQNEWVDTKYPYIVHAEASAIVNSTKKLAGCSLYVTLCSCYNCAKLIVETGIKHVYYVDDRYIKMPEFITTVTLFKKCGVTYTKIKI